MIKRDLVVIGNILVGDASSYGHLLQFTQNQISLPARPEQLIFPQAAGAQPAGLGVDALPEAATICTCRDPAKLWRFRTFVNSDARDPSLVHNPAARTASARDLGGKKRTVTRGGPVTAFALQVAAPESREDVCSFDDVMGAFFAHGQRRMHAVRPVQDEGTAAAAG
jgi:hypothetical protein